MEWIEAKKNPPVLKEMLVVCKECNHVHSVFRDYGEYCLAEWCDQNGPKCPGRDIEFDWYMELPKPPILVEFPVASSKPDDNPQNQNASFP